MRFGLEDLPETVQGFGYARSRLMIYGMLNKE